MPLILSIETATSVCSVALHREGQLLGHLDFHLPKRHANLLTPAIQFLVQSAGLTLRDLAAVAVSKGPGSYTGLRIGVATAKGLCFALGVPLIGIPTLEAMAAGVLPYLTLPETLLCPMLDARRMEVYTAVFDQHLQPVEPTAALVLNESVVAQLVADRRILFWGDGVAKCRSLLSQHAGATVLENAHPSAKAVGALAFRRFQHQQFEDLVTFEPYYLKDFVGTQPKERQ